MTSIISAGPAAARDEFIAFFDVLSDTDPHAVTACQGWTAHEISAHLASGADAFAAQIEAHLAGTEVPEFGPWETREAPYRQMNPETLLQRVFDSEERMSRAFAAILEQDPNPQVAEVGWGMPIVEIIKHMRQEYAVHRWDLLGDDDRGEPLLAQQELLTHSVELLSDGLLAVGMARDPEPTEDLDVRLRSEGHQDLRLRVHQGQGSLSLEDPDDAPHVVELDPAARLITLWGRRPSDPRRIRSTLSPEQLARLQILLAGY